MKKYELAYLISPEFNSEDIQKIQGEVESFIVENGGEILSKKIDPAKRELGCEIDDKKDALLASFIFIIDSSKIIEIKKMIDDKKSILRHILVFKDAIRKKKEKIKENKPERKVFEKVELKEIDKKIEEILNE